MSQFPKLIQVEFYPYASGISYAVTDDKSSYGYKIRDLLWPQDLLPEDIYIRAENWNNWITAELVRQNFWSHEARIVDIDADGFNQIGREIAYSIKLFVGEFATVTYCPVTSKGGYGNKELIVYCDFE